MKKSITYLVLPLLLLFSGSVMAEINHLVGFGLNAGEWSLLSMDQQQPALVDDAPVESASKPYQPSLGAAGSLGFQYELQYKPYSYSRTSLLFDAGISVMGGWTEFSRLIKDRSDHYFNFGVQVPLMIGLQCRHFYGLAGVKGNYNLINWNQTNVLLNNIVEKESHQPLKSVEQFGVDASLELGYRIGFLTSETGFDIPQRKTEYRIAFFADFGLLNWRKNIDENSMPDAHSDVLSMPDTYVDVLAMESVFGNKVVHNLFLGVKFTVLFKLPNNPKARVIRTS